MKFGLTTKDFWNVDDIFNQLLVAPKERDFDPACDVEETASHYLMTFDLPGLSTDDVKIEATADQVTISGQRASEKKEEKNNQHLTERYHGSFERSFALPAPIDAEKVEASFKDGVLRIALPKAEAVKTHQVKISEGKSGFFAKLVSGKEGKEIPNRAS